MRSMPCRPPNGTMRFEMTEAEYRQLDDEMLGLCIGCGEEREMCEPDARAYPCDGGCHQLLVYGAQELLIMGRIDFTATEDTTE